MCSDIYLVLNLHTLYIYYVEALSRLDYFSRRPCHSIWFRLLYGSKSDYFSVIKQKHLVYMWGPYLVRKRILMIDKQIEPAIDYFK